VSTKPVIPREIANADVVEALDHYLNKAGDTVASKFIDALEKAYGHIARHPASGSSRYAHELNLQGLMVWPLKRYPHLVFYMERDDHIDVWRVLHAERDIPAWLGIPEVQ
jgi:toxin ParE1/3/4